MNEERYTEIESSADGRTFIFVSEGRHGSLNKMVKFREIRDRKGIYNLALGTILPDNTLDFVTTTNNGDRNKILATVAGIVYIFMENYPDSAIYITGSDHRRTWLYHRAISFGYDELITLFNIYGERAGDEEFELFDHSKNYSGFLIEKK